MIDVAAAIISNEKGQILVCRRLDGGDCAGLWEFPGGKREPNETMEQCLVRECREELDADIEIESLYAELSYAYPTRTIHFCFFKAKLHSSQIKMHVHSKIEWAPPESLSEYKFCPADTTLVQKLAKEKAAKS